jgi:hypothetical protein
LATYHEFDGKGLDPFLDEPMQLAIQNDTLPRLKSLESNFSPVTEEAYLSYGMSYSIIDMMLKQFGEEKMRAVFALFKQGTPAEKAFEQVYGLTTDGLENQYRKSVGLPERGTGHSGIPTVRAMPTFSLSSAETPVPGGAATATPPAVSLANTPAPAAATSAPQSSNPAPNSGATTGLCGGVLGGLALAMFGAREWRKRRP